MRNRATPAGRVLTAVLTGLTAGIGAMVLSTAGPVLDAASPPRAAASQVLEDVALPPEPPDPQLRCPDIDGFGPPYEPVAWYAAREGGVLIFGSTTRFSTLSTAECSYSRPDDAGPDTIAADWATLEVYWAGAATIEEHRARPCLLEETERDGVGVVTAGDVAAYATYAVAADEPIDTAPFAAAARDLVAQVAPLAVSCDGIEPEELIRPATLEELPPFLAPAFEPAIAGSDPADPDDGDATQSGEADDVDDADDAATGAEPTVPAAGTDSDDGAGPGAEPAGVADSATGAPAWLRVLGWVATVLSMVALGLTVVLVRRPQRIRPIAEVARLAVLVVVAVGASILLAEATSPIAVVVAIVLGGAVGGWQGAHLEVRAVGQGWVARRSGWAIVAFGLGLLLTQVGGRFESVAGQSLGLAATFLAAALAVGVLVGRRPRLREARHATEVAGAVGVIGLIVLSALVPAGRTTRADDDDPNTVLPDERTETQALLVDLVDWTSVEVRGGLFADAGKPPLEVAVPAAFDEVPAPASGTTRWTVERDGWIAEYEVTETFTFGPRDDGRCCTVAYEGTGTLRETPVGAGTEGAGTEALVTTFEADGMLDDIGSVAIEGSPTSAIGLEVQGLPVGEVRAYRPPGEDDARPTADPTTCGRPVAETRSATAGEAGPLTYRVDGSEQSPPRSLTGLAVTTDCEIPGFDVTSALAIAPTPPPAADPVREGGCPVRQEVLGALAPGNALPGVDTRTVGELFLAPNAAACAGNVTLGQSGPGETRHEVGYQFARPTDPAFGEDSSLVDEIYWTDLPLPGDVPAELRCAVDAAGAPIAPADPSTGCQDVARYDLGPAGLDGVRVFVWTDWQTLDGPNVLVFVTAPWGSFSYRCHHCTPNDPQIGAFLAGVTALAVDAAETIDAVAAQDPVTEGQGDDGQGDDGSGDDGAVTPGTLADGDAGQDGDGDDAGIPSGSLDVAAGGDGAATDRSEATAVAALLGLGGAVAMLGLALGEAGGWTLSDLSGAGGGEGASPAGGDAFEQLGTAASVLGAMEEYQDAGYDPSVAAALALVEVLGGNAAGETSPFGGIGDNRLEQLAGALLPGGLASALVPSEVVTNDLRTGLQAYEALIGAIGDTWYQGELDLSAFDRFLEDIDDRNGADPFAGYSQALALGFEELYRDDGGNLLDDLSQLTSDDILGAVEEGATGFRAEVAAGEHGDVLRGVDEVAGILAEVVTDPVAAVGGLVDDLAAIAQHGVGEGYWAEVGQDVHEVLGELPVVDTIYTGYHELFSGILSHAESVDDLRSGAATAGFAAEMAEGAAALGAEAIDLVTGGDMAVRTYDYLRSWF